MITLLVFEYLILVALYGGYLLLEYYPNQKVASDLEQRIIKVLNVVILIALPLFLLLIGFLIV